MDVWRRTRSEGDWPTVLKAYEHAVGLLRKLDPPSGRPTNPMSWSYLAALHGRLRDDGRVDRGNPAWNQCQHGSWFFLPWHRMYLLAFEAIVQHTLKDEHWSLPYWYSLDPDHPKTSVLPPAFRDTKAGNNLFTKHRSQVANGGHQLPPIADTVVAALEAEHFSTAHGITSFGSGERSRPSFDGHETGLLEDTPHGGVHVLVGNDYDAHGNLVNAGWMGSLYQAAQDPIFWLHHANIDRMWEVWLRADATHQDPPAADKAWLKSSFSFPAPNKKTVTWKISEVLETAALGYVYEKTDAPSTFTPATAAEQLDRDATRPSVSLSPAEPPAPQTIGAVRDVPLASAEPTVVQLNVPPDLDETHSDFAAHRRPPRYYLRLERMKGAAAAPIYDVYVNLPAGEAEHPELRVGRIATFGLAEASRRGGPGLTKVLEITRVRAQLIADRRWDQDHLGVSFRPVVAALPAGDATRSDADTTPADVRAEQVSVVAG
jgi:tyrosinase